MGDFPEASRPALSDLLEAVNSSPMITYAVDESLRLQYCNRAWDRFAAENGAPALTAHAALGLDLHRVIAAELLPFYLRGFERARLSGRVWECLYECSSPKLFRKFQMRILPLRPLGWSLITNTLVVERPHIEVFTCLQGYENAQGQITMCCHCRNSRRVIQPAQWDFVPALLDPDVKNISHGLCPVCLEYFYPKPDSDPDRVN